MEEDVRGKAQKFEDHIATMIEEKDRRERSLENQEVYNNDR